MYEELIKRLRISAQWADKGLVITPSICLEAADAIEAMNYELKSLYKLLGTHPDPRGENGEEGVPYNRATAKAIESIPAADVRPVVRGKWIKIKYRSICRDCSFHGFASWNFCPNCGADMREPPRKCTRGRRE